jgi:preprotein translocase subunit SecA
LEYDDVANDQRQIIYQRRNELMEADDISEVIVDMREGVVNDFISTYIPPQSVEEQWDIPGLEQALQVEFGENLPIQEWLDEDKSLYEETLRVRVTEKIAESYENKSADVGPNMRVFEKQITLQILDNLWKENLSQMDSLRQGIGLRGYAGKNPKQEYKREAFAIFEELLHNIQYEVIKFLSHVKIQQKDELDAIERKREEEMKQEQKIMTHQSANLMDNSAQQKANPQEQAPAQQAPFVREGQKVGRNEPCPCGSGKKYKQCHGKLG